MSDNRMSVTGPVTVQSDSKERVAYDLMRMIQNNEGNKSRTRYEILELYTQCYQAVTGTGIGYIAPAVVK
jgi:hypothetical protein